MLRSKWIRVELTLLVDFDKCERCRKSPATIECAECGTINRSMKLCYDCDKSYH